MCLPITIVRKSSPFCLLIAILVIGCTLLTIVGCSVYSNTSPYSQNLIFDTPKVRLANQANPAPSYQSPDWPTYQLNSEDINSANNTSYNRSMYSRQSISPSGRPRNSFRYTESYQQQYDSSHYDPGYSRYDYRERDL